MTDPDLIGLDSGSILWWLKSHQSTSATPVKPVILSFLEDKRITWNICHEITDMLQHFLIAIILAW